MAQKTFPILEGHGAFEWSRGEITSDQIHEYRFPLPSGLSSRKDWRRMVVTLGRFTLINPAHRNLREAKLEFQPV
jgi:hypothetical protein